MYVMLFSDIHVDFSYHLYSIQRGKETDKFDHLIQFILFELFPFENISLILFFLLLSCIGTSLNNIPINFPAGNTHRYPLPCTSSSNHSANVNIFEKGKKNLCRLFLDNGKWIYLLLLIQAVEILLHNNRIKYEKDERKKEFDLIIG